jgi:hypothetical protein
MPKALIPPKTLASGYPGRLFVTDNDNAIVAENQTFVLTYNLQSTLWENTEVGSGVELTDDGTNWIIKNGGSTLGTGPLANVSPVGEYTGDSFTVAAVAPTGGVTQPEVTLSPGSPGTLIPEV